MPLVQPTSIINEMEMHEYISKYDSLKNFSYLHSVHPTHSYVHFSYVGTWMELNWKNECDTSSWLIACIICLKLLRSKSDEEILKVSNLRANTLHWMFPNFPVEKKQLLTEMCNSNRFINEPIMTSSRSCHLDHHTSTSFKSSPTFCGTFPAHHFQSFPRQKANNPACWREGFSSNFEQDS